jgi:hypothetical protein
MKFYIKLTMEGHFPSGFETFNFEVPENIFDKVFDILKESDEVEEVY